MTYIVLTVQSQLCGDRVAMPPPNSEGSTNNF